MTIPFHPTKSLFRNSNGQLKTRGLFIEMSYTLNDRSGVLYTLGNVDHADGYTSLYRLYMDAKDPTEAIFAKRYLDSYEHWKALCDAKWFAPYVAMWREELEQELKSEALFCIQDIAKDSTNKYHFEALKILLNAGWKEKGKQTKGRGRPSKEEIAGALKLAKDEESDLLNDLQRVKNNAYETE